MHGGDEMHSVVPVRADPLQVDTGTTDLAHALRDQNWKNTSISKAVTSRGRCRPAGAEASEMSCASCPSWPCPNRHDRPRTNAISKPLNIERESASACETTGTSYRMLLHGKREDPASKDQQRLDITVMATTNPSIKCVTVCCEQTSSRADCRSAALELRHIWHQQVAESCRI
jgi:hypothetical protein